MSKSQLDSGINIIKKISKELPKRSGVYKMISLNNEVLYIGKAKNIAKRVSSYANPMRLNYRLQKMVSLVNSIDFIVTKNEAYALLLEATLIKEIKPKFNILLKDDKSYPYIVLRKSHKWSQVKKHRGKKNKEDIYFGPFASVYHVNNTLDTLQKIFPIRTCSDHEVENRLRPCIQYQIKRCSAPCTNLIELEEYNTIVQNLNSFLLGKSNKVMHKLLIDMNTQSKNLNYEKAGVLRDKIRSLEKINQSSNQVGKNDISADIFCITQINDIVAIEIIFVRNSRNFGSNTHYPFTLNMPSLPQVLNKFIVQFYNRNKVPHKIYTSIEIAERKLLEQALNIKSQEFIKVSVPKESILKKIIEVGTNKAKKNLANKIALNTKTKKLHDLLAEKFHFKKEIFKIEVYDNSHFSGKEAIGSFIVADNTGYRKKEYRKFNIKEAATNDDYGMMKEVLTRRFLGKETSSFPDLIIIDGGLGQLSVAKKVLTTLNIKNVEMISISKGKLRNSSNETFYDIKGNKISLSKTEPLFYYLQRLRDEAHRFAITNHRTKREKEFFKSEMDYIDKIGPKRKKNLILYFGSLNELKRASLEKLEKVPGINKKIAETIYNYFNIN